MSSPPSTHTARLAASVDGEAATLADIYEFVLDAADRREKAAGGNGGEDNAKGDQNGFRAATILPQD